MSGGREKAPGRLLLLGNPLTYSFLRATPGELLRYADGNGCALRV